MRSILKAATAIFTLAARGVGRTFAVMGQGALSVFDMIAQGLAHAIDLPFALVRSLRPAPAPVPVAPAEAAASEVIAALEEAQQLGPEKILADGRELLAKVEANPPRRSEYDAKACPARINEAFSDAEKILHRKTGWEASAIAHWALCRVDGIATDAARADISHLTPHLQVWARSLTPAQVAEVAKMPRQMLHHHLTSDDCKVWSKTLPAAGLDTAERAKHGIRTAMAASRDGTVDPYPQQAALDGIARKRELDAYRDFDYEPAGLKI